MRTILGGLFTVLTGIVLTVVTRPISLRLGLMARPRTDRWHRKPTALLGGVAIYLAFLTGYIGFAQRIPGFYPVLAMGTLLLVTGLIDDIVQIKPYAKLIVQLVAAGVVVFYGLRLPWTSHEAINDFITIFWLVGMTNALNLLDNMDGLAAGISVISSIFIAAIFIINGQAALAAIPILLGGAVLGFLVFNFSPATIFMGDCGSMFLGFVLAATALLSEYGRFSNLTAVLLTPVLIMAIPIFDTCVVVVSRILSGRPISQGGRDHTSHRIVALGTSERRAVIMLYIFAASSGFLALMVRVVEIPIVLVLVPVFALLVVSLGFYLGKVRVYEDGDRLGLSGKAIVGSLTTFPYNRRVFEVMLDVLLVALAYYGAYLLRWDGGFSGEQVDIFLKTLPLVIVIQMAFLLIGGVYRGLWRYMDIDDLLVVVKSVLAGTAAAALAVFAMYRFRGPSRAVFLLDILLLMCFMAASRLSFRIMRSVIVGRMRSNPDAVPVLIYGAGDAGALLVRELLNNPSHRYAPVGFIDDDHNKAGKLIHGYRIFGGREVSRAVSSLGVSEVLISSAKVPDYKLENLRRMGISPRKLSIRIE